MAGDERYDQTHDQTDDELAALLALDALPADEQADAELRHGTFPQQYRDIVGVLAEASAAAPPATSTPGRRTGAPRPTSTRCCCRWTRPNGRLARTRSTAPCTTSSRT
jgi:hypothetical protein